MLKTQEIKTTLPILCHSIFPNELMSNEGHSAPAYNMLSVSDAFIGRYFVLQDEVDPPPPPGSLKNEACVVGIIPAVATRRCHPPLPPSGHPHKLCELLLYSTCLSNSYGARIHFVHGSTSSCKTKYLPFYNRKIANHAKQFLQLQLCFTHYFNR